MFSVIMPAYNAETFIARAIDSVLSQTYPDFELIVVDDGSTDATKERVLSFSDERIRYVYQKNGGVSAARNQGILESRGEYICFLDSDDEWRPEHLSVLFALTEKYPDCAMRVTGYDIRLGDGTLIHKSQSILRAIPEEDFKSDNAYDLLNRHGYFLNTNTVCCERGVFDRLGLFAEGVKNGEDDDMWYRIFAYYPVAVSKRATTVYDRANCGATAKRDIPVETFFLRRVEGLLASSDVEEARKASLAVWRERNKLSRVRRLILAGDKREARRLLRTVDRKRVRRKKLLGTYLSLLLPQKLVRRAIDKRDAAYYR